MYYCIGTYSYIYHEIYSEGADICQVCRDRRLHCVYTVYEGDTPTALKAQTDRLA
jgi:hypothetical protein